MKKLLMSLFATLTTVSLLLAQQVKDDVQSIADKYKAVGVAYVVVKNNKIIEKKCYRIQLARNAGKTGRGQTYLPYSVHL